MLFCFYNDVLDCKQTAVHCTLPRSTEVPVKLMMLPSVLSTKAFYLSDLFFVIRLPFHPPCWMAIWFCVLSFDQYYTQLITCSFNSRFLQKFSLDIYAISTRFQQTWTIFYVSQTLLEKTKKTKQLHCNSIGRVRFGKGFVRLSISISDRHVRLWSRPWIYIWIYGGQEWEVCWQDGLYTIVIRCCETFCQLEQIAEKCWCWCECSALLTAHLSFIDGQRIAPCWRLHPSNDSSL